MKNPDHQRWVFWAQPEWIHSTLSLSFALMFFLLSSPRGALSADNPKPGGDHCESRHCGNGFKISYASSIRGQNPLYCGYPGLETPCKDNAPVVDASGNLYLVQKIFYDNYSAIVSSVDISVNPCPYPRRNLSLAGTPFAVSSISNRELFFYLNCTQILSSPARSSWEIKCASNRNGRISFVTDLPVRPYEDASRSCESLFVLPFLSSGTAGGGVGYEGLVRNGFLVEWEASDCSSCENSGGRCGYSRTSDQFKCICRDRVAHGISCEPMEPSSSQNIHKRIIIIGTIAGASGLLLACITLYCWCYQKHSNLSPIWPMKSRTSQNVKACLEQYGSIVPKRYKYAEVKKITKSFIDKLGQGGYGTVFKGKLLDNRLVAVKVLNKSKGSGEEFINEVVSIGRTQHVNIVNLLGFCCEGSKRALIYEFMPNGSLDTFIFLSQSRNMTFLGWKKLFEIAIGIARGLEYLHHGCNTRIVHFDIKPHNILLDEDFCPKISDFGLAKSYRPKQSILSTVGARGTIGYIAPEVFSRRFGVISNKSDVYSYGMVILEMVGGRKKTEIGMDNSSDAYFPQWIYEHFNDNDALQLSGITNEAEEITRKMALVGLWCIQTNPSSRPTMSKVLKMLEGNLKDVQMPPKPYLSSP